MWHCLDAAVCIVYAVEIQLHCLHEALMKLMESDLGLTSFLPPKVVDGMRQRELHEERNEEILNYLLRTSDNTVISHFIRTLTRTNQQHVFNYIESNGSRKLAISF